MQSKTMSKLIGWSWWGPMPEMTRPKDTPDGAGYTRPLLMQELANRGHTIAPLQDNLKYFHQNSLEKCPTYIETRDPWIDECDVFIFEWRWPIPGRNTGENPKTPELKRQTNLLKMLLKMNKQIIIWDKDMKMTSEEIATYANVFTLADPAFMTRKYMHHLPFPVNINDFGRVHVETLQKTCPLVYIGNQYERDEMFDTYYGTCSNAGLHTMVYGNWTKYPELLKQNKLRWPKIQFNDRLEFERIFFPYKQSWATILIAPDRYLKRGHITQRIFECLIGGCMPLAVEEQQCVKGLIVPENIVNHVNVEQRVKEIMEMTNLDYNLLLYKQMKLLEPHFKVERIADKLEKLWGITK